MTILFFPGRHLLQTTFQQQYLQTIVQSPLDGLTFLPNQQGLPHQHPTTPINTIVFAITSANHQFTRYNPIPFHIRAIGVDRFAAHFAHSFVAEQQVTYRIFGIPHYAPSPRFAAIMLKEIAEQTEGDLTLTPVNTIVLSSTISVAEQFQELGYSILPAEASVTPMPATPQHMLTQLMSEGKAWQSNTQLRAQIAPTTLTLWRDFPETLRRIYRLWHDPLLTDDGSLTQTRNYSTYAQDMSNHAVIQVKYNDIKTHILGGRIVDEGCADGALLVRIAQDFPDSDLIGIEITGELLSRCHERQRAGEFGESFVHFHQRNITTPIFQPGTIHTTICNSTLHELWSYNDQHQTVLKYLHEKYRQLAPRGRLIIRDVIGPENLEETVYLWLNDTDGTTTHQATSATKLHELSTLARFHRFAQDFLPQRKTAPNQSLVPYAQEQIDNRSYIVTTMRLATEYITKKDYLDNWDSEMHEEFAFWSLSDWQSSLREIGFITRPSSHTYTNPWIVENRWKQQVEIYRRSTDGVLSTIPFPPTTMILVAEKPPQT